MGSKQTCLTFALELRYDLYYNRQQTITKVPCDLTEDLSPSTKAVHYTNIPEKTISQCQCSRDMQKLEKLMENRRRTLVTTGSAPSADNVYVHPPFSSQRPFPSTLPVSPMSVSATMVIQLTTNFYFCLLFIPIFFILQNMLHDKLYRHFDTFLNLFFSLII